MDWTPRLTQLNDVLGDLVPHPDGIATFIRAAGLKTSMVNFNGNAMNIWTSVIDEARKNGKVDALVDAVQSKYPDNPFLKSAKSLTEINYSLGPKIDDITNWQAIQPDTLEVLTMGGNTLLPIYFLERGVIRSRSVAKVEIRNGPTVNVGTGFLFKLDGIDDLFFMTNSHVINDKSLIERTKVIFDYEEDIDGNTKNSMSFSIDAGGPWYTSPVLEFDVTIFKLHETEGLAAFGHIPLHKVEVEKNDFVNIIQHPGGQLKKIALYHNVVTHKTERVLQYLTDTMKGSSGAPVFNTNWEVVALHHSGGDAKISEPELKESKYRNEGICINQIIDFLKLRHGR